MYYVAFFLALAAGIFYLAGTDGLWADPICRHGRVFCDHPLWVGVAAILALIWGAFVSV